MEQEMDALARPFAPRQHVKTIGNYVQAKAVRSLRKRSFDVIVSALWLLLLLPVFVLVSVAIVIGSKGPVFFLQRRTGLDGRPFKIIKFRTMHVMDDSDDVQQTRKNDERVTAVGRFLRRTSIDELPQLINIVTGDMSVVGPRPHAVSHDDRFSRFIPDYSLRFRVRPGLTGLAQIRGLRGEVTSDADVKGRVEADLQYIQEWSFRRDIEVILKTVPLLFRDHKAY